MRVVVVVKKINWLLVIGMIIGTLYYVVLEYDSDRILTYLAVIPVLVAPLLLKKTKFKLSDRELCCYYVFVFMADFIGCVANLYNTTEWYDVFVHFCSGIFTFGVGLFILDKINIGKDNFGFKMFFSIGVVALVAVVWELFEYGADVLLRLDFQHNVDTGVDDTMVDMLAAIVGGLLSIVGCYVINKRNRAKNLVN